MSGKKYLFFQVKLAVLDYAANIDTCADDFMRKRYAQLLKNEFQPMRSGDDDDPQSSPHSSGGRQT